MLAFLVRRVLLLVPTVLGVTLLVFATLHMSSGDPVSAMLGQDYSEDVARRLREQYRLDDSLFAQYGAWLLRVAQGDMGRSYAGFGGEPVSIQIADRFPTTLALSVAALALACMTGIPLGVGAARFRDSVFDNVVRVVAMLGVSMPVFWIGILLMMVFSIHLGWLPAGGSFSRYGLSAFVLPAISLAIPFACTLTQLTRSTVLEVLDEDYVRTAHSKGLANGVVVYKHALRNALIALVTVIGMQFGLLIGGSVIIETVFSLPGIGRLLVDAVYQRNYPVVQGVSMVIALAFVAANLIVDLTYAWLDPRIRY